VEEFVGEPIPSEDVLWELLQRILEDPSAVRQTGPPQIAGWQPELLYFPDEPVGHSINPTTARAISEFHIQLSRAYAYLVYGQANARLLKNEDKAFLEVKILVKDGSNGYDILEEALQRLIQALFTKMTGEQVLIIIIVFLLLYFGTTVTRDWISRRYQSRDRETDSIERRTLSEEETKRLTLLREALRQHEVLEPVRSAAEESKMALTKGAAKAPRARVVGAEMTVEEAKAIVAQERRTGEGRRLDGQFEVIEIGTENPDGYIGRLRNMRTLEEFDVEINYDDLTEQDIDVLFKSARDKISISALVNAWFLGGKPTRAVVMRANEIKANDEAE